MSTHSIIEHRANYFYVRLEDDYLTMYEKINQEIEAFDLPDRQTSGPADCKAMITSILEHWMNSKRLTAKSEDDLYVYFTYDEWEHQLRYRYKRSIIIRCLKEMPMEGQWLDEQGEIHVGTIKVKPYVQNTFAYVLNTKVVQGLVSALPEQSPYGPRPKTNLGRPRKKNRADKNSLKINGINLNGLNTDGIPIIPSENKRNNAEIPFKNKRSFYTQISNTQTDNTQISDGASAFASAGTHTQSSQDDIAQQIRSRIPQGDAILLERLSNGNHRIYRKSGRPIGELIPQDVDVSEGLLELITVEATPYVPDNLSQFTEMSPVLQEHRVLEKQVAELQQVVESQAIRMVKPTTPASPSMDNSVNVVPEPAQGYKNPAELSTLTIPQQGGNRAYRSTDSVDHSSGVRGGRAQRSDERPTTSGTPAAHGKDQSAERRAQVVQDAMLSVQKPLSARAKMDQQIDQALGWLDVVRMEAANQTYVRTQAARKELEALIKAGAQLSQENVRMAWMELWNRPADERFDWKSNMTIRAFCNNYDNALTRAQAPKKPTSQSGQRSRAASPNAAGVEARLPEDLAQRNKDRLKARYDEIMAAKAAK